MTNNTTTTPKLSRSEQARINGAKSKGPITEEGKAKSSRNSLKHGFAAQANVLLAPEDAEAWKTHLAGYRASFNNPTNLFESDLVDQLASIAWRKSRLVSLETAIIDFQLSIQKNEVQRLFPDNAEDANFHFVLAWQALARKSFIEEVENPTLPPQNLDGLSLELVRRYQTSLDRQFRNALTNLRQYRKDFGNQAPAQQQPQQQQQQPEPHEPESETIPASPKSQGPLHPGTDDDAQHSTTDSTNPAAAPATQDDRGITSHADNAIVN